MYKKSISQIKQNCNAVMATVMIATHTIAPVGAAAIGYCVIPGRTACVIPAREPETAIVETVATIPTDGDFDLWPILPEIPVRQSARDVELLACAICQEAGGDDCSDASRIYVGNVIVNRSEHPGFPDTIEGVLTQYRQYGRYYWTGVVWPEWALDCPEAMERARDCARRVLGGERPLETDVIWQAEFPQGEEIVVYQDGIYFCR